MRSNTLLSPPMKARFYCLPEVFYLFDTVKKVFFNPQPISEPIFLSSAYKMLQTPGFFPMGDQIGLILSYLALSRRAQHPLLFPVDALGFSWHAAGPLVSMFLVGVEGKFSHVALVGWGNLKLESPGLGAQVQASLSQVDAGTLMSRVSIPDAEGSP